MVGAAAARYRRAVHRDIVPVLLLAAVDASYEAVVSKLPKKDRPASRLPDPGR